MQNRKIKFIQTTILIVTLFTYTGCFFGFFEDEPKVQFIEPQTVETKIVEPKIELAKVTTSKVETIMPTPVIENIASENIVAECTDEISSPCHKEPITSQELSTSQSLVSSNNATYRLRSIQGKNITIEAGSTGYQFPEFQNKIVILEMFGKSCSHCIKEMPTMRKLKKRYGRYLEIVAVQVEGKMSKRQANALLRRHRITYPVIAGDRAKELQYHVQNTFGWLGTLPFIMVIKDGVTEFTYRGSVSYNRINKDIRSLLK